MTFMQTPQLPDAGEEERRVSDFSEISKSYPEIGWISAGVPWLTVMRLPA